MALPFSTFLHSLPEIALFALLISCTLLIRSLFHFSRTGPKIQNEIRKHYFTYSCFAILRLTLWTSAILLWLASLGIITLINFSTILALPTNTLTSIIAAASSIFLITLLQFSKHLFFIPSSIMMSFNYGMRRLIPFWRHLSKARLLAFESTIIIFYLLSCITQVLFTSTHNGIALSTGWFTFCLVLLAPYVYCLIQARQPKPIKANTRQKNKPNIIMIGCDTLRSDRLGINNYHRKLTPNIDKLSQSGTTFTQCYTPIARTAPSLVSLFTGLWPSSHGVRTNFVSDKQTKLKADTLPGILAENGYNTSAITDWCGSDLKKFDFGFQHVESPEDQWNLKYLIRQGPKDLRLFLSLFTHNKLGKLFIPELYYLAGVPLTDEVSTSAKQHINKHVKQGEPFFTNIFYSSSHPPFGSKPPYYRQYADPAYEGESFFGMARLTDPDEIIKSQREPKEAFDLDQIIDLYDGSVASFDSAVGELVDHLSSCDLIDNTIIVIYSDHGLDFFEGNSWGQGNTVLTNNSYTIPFVLRAPGLAKTGNKIDQVTRTVDIAPTILELAGIRQTDKMDGTSLMQLLSEADIDLDLCAFIETGEWLAPPPQQDEHHKTYPTIDNILTIENIKSGTISIDSTVLDIVYDAKDQAIIYKHWKLCRLPLNDGEKLVLKNLKTGKIIPVDATHDFLIKKFTPFIKKP